MITVKVSNDFGNTEGSMAEYIASEIVNDIDGLICVLIFIPATSFYREYCGTIDRKNPSSYRFSGRRRSGDKAIA